MSPFLKKDNCPNCKMAIDHATSLDNSSALPAHGDYSLCIECGCILIYNKKMNVIKANGSELLDLTSEDYSLLLRAQRLILDKK